MLYGVAQNVVSAERRRQTRELRANLRISGRRLLTADDVTRLEERIDAEAWHELLQEMDELPAGERAVLELVALDGPSPRHPGTGHQQRRYSFTLKPAGVVGATLMIESTGYFDGTGDPGKATVIGMGFAKTGSYGPCGMTVPTRPTPPADQVERQDEARDSR